MLLDMEMPRYKQPRSKLLSRGVENKKGYDLCLIPLTAVFTKGTCSAAHRKQRDRRSLAKLYAPDIILCNNHLYKQHKQQLLSEYLIALTG